MQSFHLSYSILYTLIVYLFWWQYIDFMIDTDFFFFFFKLYMYYQFPPIVLKIQFWPGQGICLWIILSRYWRETRQEIIAYYQHCDQSLVNTMHILQPVIYLINQYPRGPTV